MTASDKVFAGSIPALYETYLVPLIFNGFAADLAQRVAASGPQSVLEIAAGTGALTRQLAPKLAAGACYVASDLNQPMLDEAMARQGGDPRIVWRQADASKLPFPDEQFDTVCCQFGVMFFPDRVTAYKEARRVLKSGGRFTFNVWDRIEENVFADVVTSALAELYPSDPPQFLARIPHGYHDEPRIRADLAAAEFAHMTIQRRAEQSRAASPRHPAIAYCQGTPLRTEIEARQGASLAQATDHAAAAIARLHGSGEVAAKIQGLVVEASL